MTDTQGAARAEYEAENLAEIADYFDTLASDQRSCVRFKSTQRDKAACLTRAEVWADAANIIRNTKLSSIGSLCK
jgi:hypothetical protein